MTSFIPYPNKTGQIGQNGIYRRTIKFHPFALMTNTTKITTARKGKRSFSIPKVKSDNGNANNPFCHEISCPWGRTLRRGTSGIFGVHGLAGRNILNRPFCRNRSLSHVKLKEISSCGAETPLRKPTQTPPHSTDSIFRRLGGRGQRCATSIRLGHWCRVGLANWDDLVSAMF